MTYVLHYAPDNASLVIRWALEHLGLPYSTALVDRSAKGQHSQDYLAINPNGLIPALETPEGPLFETAAILLWLSDRHGGFGPAPDAPTRGTFLKWLFFVSNTCHANLRLLFYPDQLVDAAHIPALQAGATAKLRANFRALNTQMADPKAVWDGDGPSALDIYIAAVMRWSGVYPRDYDRSWFDLADYPALARICTDLEDLAATSQLCQAEGMGRRPFSDPHPPQPPEGSAT